MPEPLRIELPGYAFEMVFVKGGTFRMGLSENTKDAYGDEYPDHDVTIKDFYIGRYPVTQALWQTLVQVTPEFNMKFQTNHMGLDHPAVNIFWEDAKEKFLPALNTHTKCAFRLPTEAEWEYAARGGPQWKDGYQFAGSDKLREVGWYADNSGNETQPVGQLYPNALGLYDMSGNVWEWCEDDWHDNYEGAPIDGSPWIDRPDRGYRRVRRGGSDWYGSWNCRVVSRKAAAPSLRYGPLGFRLALSK